MKTFYKVLDWFAYSSANPEKLSLTLKAGLPFLALVLGFLGFQDSGIELGEGFDALVLVITGLGSIITGGVTLYGFGRKVAFTVSDYLKSR